MCSSDLRRDVGRRNQTAVQFHCHHQRRRVARGKGRSRLGVAVDLDAQAVNVLNHGKRGPGPDHRHAGSRQQRGRHVEIDDDRRERVVVGLENRVPKTPWTDVLGGRYSEVGGACLLGQDDKERPDATNQKGLAHRRFPLGLRGV